MQNTSKIQTLAYTVISIIGIGWLMVLGAPIILPIIFALLFAIFIHPIEQKIEKYVGINIISIILSFIVFLIPFVIVASLFSIQLASIIDNLPSVTDNMKLGFERLMSKMNQKIPFLDLEKIYSQTTGKSVSYDGPLKILGKGIESTTGFLASLGLTIIFTFFLLLYKTSFTNFIIYQFEKSARPDIKETLSKISLVIKSYIGGLGVVIILLSIFNSIGLAIIGVDYAIFWGTLAGILAAVPYIGTIIGGMLPFIYCLATADHNWQPIAVIVYYLIIQQVEGNLITPKIVGDRVDINPFFAILSLVFFGSLWGVAGIFLALPLVSIIKIVLSNFEESLPYSVLMSSNVSTKKGVFRRLANKSSSS